MNVDIEFFSENPMDNVLSCMKFVFQKVIFFGFTQEDMDRAATSTVAAFLKSKNINVEQIDFVALPEGKLDVIEKELGRIVSEEIQAGNKCYIDLTGGEELALAAAGVVSDKYNIPMHEIDLADDEVRVQAHPEAYTQLPKRDYRMDIEEYLNLHEGVIEWKMQKDKNKDYKDEAHKSRIMELNRFLVETGKKWNKISLGLANFCSGQHVTIYGNAKEVSSAAKTAKIPVPHFLGELSRMQDRNILQSFRQEDGLTVIEFYNEEEQKLLCDPGAVLEHLTYWQVVQDTEVNDCAIGYHINWIGDGDPDSIYKPGPDVINEIDIIYMRKNIPTFVSCKNKMVSNNQPLYELETVADRFGGKLVRKVLLAKDGVSSHIKKRAEEMDIEVVKHL